LCEGVTSVWPSEPCLVHFQHPYRAFLRSQSVLLHSPDRHTDTSSHLVFCAHCFPHHWKRCSNSFARVCTSGCRVVCFVFCSARRFCCFHSTLALSHASSHAPKSCISALIRPHSTIHSAGAMIRSGQSTQLARSGISHPCPFPPYRTQPRVCAL
jgi:hypothetical protein